MLDPDPHKTDADLKHWLEVWDAIVYCKIQKCGAFLPFKSHSPG
jgi:hypothetical protein